MHGPRTGTMAGLVAAAVARAPANNNSVEELAVGCVNAGGSDRKYQAQGQEEHEVCDEHIAVGHLKVLVRAGTLEDLQDWAGAGNGRLSLMAGIWFKSFNAQVRR